MSVVSGRMWQLLEQNERTPGALGLGASTARAGSLSDTYRGVFPAAQPPSITLRYPGPYQHGRALSREGTPAWLFARSDRLCSLILSGGQPLSHHFHRANIIFIDLAQTPLLR